MFRILIRKVDLAGLIITPDVAKEVVRIVARGRRLDGFGNAGAVETILGRAKTNKATRLSAAAIEARSSARTRKSVKPNLLLLEDFVSEVLSADLARTEFSSLEFCDKIYEFIDRLEATKLQARNEGKSPSDLLAGYHMVFTGPVSAVLSRH